MRFVIRLTDDSVTLLRRAGYCFQKHVSDDEMAFVRPLGRGDFPRFHIYAKEYGFGALIIKIHLDARP